MTELVTIMSLTESEIYALPAGRELDALIAEHVLNWRKMKGPSYDYDGPTESKDILIPPDITDAQIIDGYIWHPKGVVPEYYFCKQWSTSTEHAMNLVEDMRLNGIGIDMYSSRDGYQVIVSIGRKKSMVVAPSVDKTLPLAICHASLLAFHK